MEAFFTAITNFGFPIVVAAYLLFRFENKLEKLEDAINGKDGVISKIDKMQLTCGKRTKE